MVDTFEILCADDARWDDLVARAPHDFHHLSGYHRLAESAGEGTARLYVYGDEERFLAWPCLLRRMSGGLSDATSVYGYTGPVGLGFDSGSARKAAWSAFRGAWAEERIVTLFTRFHPILANQEICADLHGAEAPPGGELLAFGRSVSIDLALSLDERRAGYPQALRQEVKRAERNGLEVALDTDWRQFGAFVSFYRDTMRRNDASGRYLFSEEYFAGLRRALSHRAHLVVATVEGEVAGALLLVIENGIATAHLTGLNPAFTKFSPLKPLLDRSCDLARDLGASLMHLGAGRGGAEDKLFAFKARFSPIRNQFVAGRFILDPEANAHLARGRDSETRFFPAYRAPAAAERGAA